MTLAWLCVDPYDSAVHQRTRSILAQVILVLLLPAMVSPAGWVVMCINDSGHIAIEVAHTLEPCDEATLAGQAVESNHHRVTDPSDCTDLPIARTSILTARCDEFSIADELAAAPLLHVLTSWETYPLTAAWSDRHATLPIAQTPQRLLRSVILNV